MGIQPQDWLKFFAERADSLRTWLQLIVTSIGPVVALVGTIVTYLENSKAVGPADGALYGFLSITAVLGAMFAVALYLRNELDKHIYISKVVLTERLKSNGAIGLLYEILFS